MRQAWAGRGGPKPTLDFDALRSIQLAEERFGRTGSGGTSMTRSGAAGVLANLTAECGSITYADDCYAAAAAAVTAAGAMAAPEQAQIRQRLRDIIGANRSHAARLREIASRGGLALDP